MHGCLIALLVVAGLIVLGVIVLFAFFGYVFNKANEELKKDHVIVYEATGGSSASKIFYSTSTVEEIGKTPERKEQELSDTPLPWRKEETVTGILGVNLSVVSFEGPATCKITIDGKVVHEDTGPTTANCHGVTMADINK